MRTHDLRGIRASVQVVLSSRPQTLQTRTLYQDTTVMPQTLADALATQLLVLAALGLVVLGAWLRR